MTYDPYSDRIAIVWANTHTSLNQFPPCGTGCSGDYRITTIAANVPSTGDISLTSYGPEHRFYNPSNPDYYGYNGNGPAAVACDAWSGSGGGMQCEALVIGGHDVARNIWGWRFRIEPGTGVVSQGGPYEVSPGGPHFTDFPISLTVPSLTGTGYYVAVMAGPDRAVEVNQRPPSGGSGWQGWNLLNGGGITSAQGPLVVVHPAGSVYEIVYARD